MRSTPFDDDQHFIVDDYRLFCGNLENEVNDEVLSSAFKKYPSFQKAKVIMHKITGKTKGYGFASFQGARRFRQGLEGDER